MLNQSYQTLSELKTLYRDEYSEKLKRDYDAKKLAKALKRKPDCTLSTEYN